MNAAVRDESQQRVIHRLESFSDIVIGFSLAQLALSMTIPHNGARGLLAHPAPLAAFGVTFTLVCGMWWLHHRLFTHYFVPIAPMIMLNFITLAGVSFAVYSVQLMVRPHPSSLDFAFYLGALAVVYLLLSVEFFYGWIKRRDELAAAIADDGFRSALIVFGVGLAAAIGCVLTIRFGLDSRGFAYFGWFVFAYVFAVRLTMRRFRSNQRAAQVR